MKPYRFEPDLARAATLPADWYRDPAVLAREQERLFGRTWQLVGHRDQVACPGDFFTCTVAEEPVLVVRGEEAPGALSNVCRHRAGPVAVGQGNRKAFSCGYHGWTYSQDGRLLGTPEWEGVQDFDRSRTALPRFRLESWGPLVFVNLDSAAPALRELLGPIPEETKGFPFERARFYKRLDYEIACNWKVYVDNYLEGYHIPVVHPRLSRELDYGAYRTEVWAYASKQHAPLRRGQAGDSLYARRLEEGTSAEALYYWVFPNLMLNFYPDNLQTNLILPLGPERTLTRFEWYWLDPDREEMARDWAGSFAFSDEVQKEDVAVCEAVQRGLASRTYDQGRYSVARENGLHHFHGLLARYLQDEPPGP
jgi:phenylpropionate dioxygenase-like ring-hydroxylating dioxygenase large terminal subunit